MEDVSRSRDSALAVEVDDDPAEDSSSRRECWAWICVHACSHAGLAILVVAYTLLGAVLFELVEGGVIATSPRPPTPSASSAAAAERRGLAVQKSRDECLRELWTITERLNVLYERNWTRLVHEQLRKFEINVVAAAQVGNNEDTPNEVQETGPQHAQWSFGGALLYSVTVITTIGYGNLSPRTPLGKVLTMIYATFGVPLMLLCLSSLGQLLARAVHFVYIKLTCQYQTENQKHSNNSQSSTKTGNDKRNDYKYQRAPTSPGRSSCASTHDSSIIQLSTPHKSLPTPHTIPPPLNTPKKSPLATINSNHTRPRCRLLSIHSSIPPPPPAPDVDDPEETDDAESGNFAHDTPSRIPLIWREDSKATTATTSSTSSPENHQVSVPISIVLVVLSAYLCLGAFVFAAWENWSYLDATYFCFITLSTIGFGDLVPGKTFPSAEEYGHLQLVLCSGYLVVGLILVAMSFSLIHDEVIGKCKQIANSLGLNHTH